MQEDELKNKIEALVFSAGRKITLAEISKLCREKNIDLVREKLFQLKKEYEERGSPLLFIQEGQGEDEGWKLIVKEKHLSTVKKITPHTELSKSILETLAIIAWKQPIFQSEVVHIRSNKAYEHVNELEKLGFISKQKKGRSFLLKTTARFLDYFDLPNQEAAKDMFKGIKGVEKIEKQIEELEKERTPEEKEAAKEEKEKLGKLEVYETEPEKEEEPVEQGEMLGKLEVYEEPEEKTWEEIEKPVETEKKLEEGSKEEVEGTVEKIKEMAEEIGKIGKEEEKEETEELVEEEKEEPEEESEEKPEEEEKKLPEELEEFIEEKPEEEKEETEEEQEEQEEGGEAKAEVEETSEEEEPEEENKKPLHEML